MSLFIQVHGLSLIFEFNKHSSYHGDYPCFLHIHFFPIFAYLLFLRGILSFSGLTLSPVFLMVILQPDLFQQLPTFLTSFIFPRSLHIVAPTYRHKSTFQALALIPAYFTTNLLHLKSVCTFSPCH